MMQSVSLRENAISFINESIQNARRSKRQPKYWAFAILHLIQGLERKRAAEALWKPNHCMSTIADRARRRMVCT